MPANPSRPQCPSTIVDDVPEDITGLASPPPGRCPSDIVYDQPENVSGISESTSSRCPSDIGEGLERDPGDWF